MNTGHGLENVLEEFAARLEAGEAEERRRADTNFRRSVEEYSLLLVIVNKEARTGPAPIDKVRQDQASRVINFVQDLLQEHRADPEGRLLTGYAHEALAQAYFGLADYARAGDFYARAIEMYEHLAADFPQETQYQQVLKFAWGHLSFLMVGTLSDGKRLMSAGKWAEAAEAYRAILTSTEKYPPREDVDTMNQADLAYGLARALRALGRSGEAEEPCTRAVNYHAKLITANSGNVYVPLCQIEQAGAYTLRGLIRGDLGRRAEAEADFRQAIALMEAAPPRVRRILVTHDTNQPLAHHALGDLLWATDRGEEATKEYKLAEKAWRDEPRNARSRSCLAWLLATCPDVQLRKPAEAVELAKQATADPPWPDARPWQALGAAQYRGGNAKEALAALEKSRQLSGGDGIGGFLLAMVYWQQGEKEQARRWHDAAVSWMEKRRPHDPEMLRLRDEAASLLGVAPKKD
jgi:tetratricopeptide (TPR) repeat protein